MDTNTKVILKEEVVIEEEHIKIEETEVQEQINLGLLEELEHKEPVIVKQNENYGPDHVEKGHGPEDIGYDETLKNDRELEMNHNIDKSSICDNIRYKNKNFNNDEEIKINEEVIIDEIVKNEDTIDHVNNNDLTNSDKISDIGYMDETGDFDNEVEELKINEDVVILDEIDKNEDFDNLVKNSNLEDKYGVNNDVEELKIKELVVIVKRLENYEGLEGKKTFNNNDECVEKNEILETRGENVRVTCNEQSKENKRKENNKEKRIIMKGAGRISRENVKQNLCKNRSLYVKLVRHLWCQYCVSEFNSRKLMRAHERRCANNLKSQTEFKCEKCGFKFNDEKVLQAHTLKWCTGNRIDRKKPKETITCDFCNYETQIKSRMKDHMIVHNTDTIEWFKCSSCPYKANRKQSRHQHEWKWCKAIPRVCALCEETFKVQIELDNHLLRKHGEDFEKVRELIYGRVYSCVECDEFRTLQKAEVDKHVKAVHRKDRECLRSGRHGKNSTCDQCKYRFFCNECPYKTDIRCRLTLHKIRHNKKTATWYDCEHCSYKTTVKNCFNQHMFLHTNTTTCTCPICEKPFRVKLAMQDHLVRMHGDDFERVRELVTVKVYDCIECGQFRTIQKRSFNQHVESMHRGAPKRRPLVLPKKETSTADDVKFTTSSKKSSNPETLYQCQYCKCMFNTKKRWKGHEQSFCKKRPVDKEKPLKIFSCDICEFTTDTKRVIEQHRWVHDTKTAHWYYCEECPYKTVRAEALVKHAETHTNMFKCIFKKCQKGFRLKRNLDEHWMDEHSDEFDKFRELITTKVYNCKDCGKFRTVVKSIYIKHVESEHGKQVYRPKTQEERIYEITCDTTNCEVNESRQKFRCKYCGRTFIDQERYQNHELRMCKKRLITSRHLTNTLSCTMCHYKTNYQKTLNAHMLRHQIKKARWLFCDKCSYRTMRKGSLKVHVQLHGSKDRPLACHICRYPFALKRSLNEHLIRAHGADFEKVRDFISCKVYRCEECGWFRTVHRKTYREHVAMHKKKGGLQQFSCPHCKFITFGISSLVMHMKRRHCTDVNERDRRSAVKSLQNS